MISKSLTGDLVFHPVVLAAAMYILTQIIQNLFHHQDTKYRKAEQVLNDIIEIQKAFEQGTSDNFQEYRNQSVSRKSL